MAVPSISLNSISALWRAGRSGMGSAFLAASIDMYFERFDLQRLASEPYAENRAPNRALPKLGFRLVERFRGVPTGIAFEQDVNRWEITREEWLARRSGAVHGG